MSIKQNLEEIGARIQRACLKTGRDPATVRLVAVSKLHPAQAVVEAADAGQVIFGENYVQELLEKADQIGVKLQWHLIGHLQSNKVKYLPGVVSLIHTVDRLSLAKEINRQWQNKAGKPCNILVQVNISGEASKSGTTADDAKELVSQVAQLPFIRVQGLMTMPPFFDDPEAARPYFAGLRKLADEIRAMQLENVIMDELSMGMSGDFEVAIEEGATLVRVGTAIFGAR